MTFTIYSGIPGRVVSVQVDDQGSYDVVGLGATHARAVNMGFADVHVAGGGITQAQRVTGVANGSKYEVVLLNNAVRIQPRP